MVQKKITDSKLLAKESDRSFATQVSFHIARADDSFWFNFHVNEDTAGNPIEQKFIKTCCQTVITNCLEELSVLTNIYARIVEKYPVAGLEYRTLDERFGRTDGHFKDYRIGDEYTDMHKLQKDIGVIMYLIKSLIDAVKIGGTFYNALTLMKNLENMYRDEEDLINHLSDKLELLAHMRTASSKEKSMSVEIVTLLNNAIRETIRQYQDQREYNNQEINFVEKWQNARHEQNKLKLEQKENGYENTTESMNWEILMEKRCHAELETYILESNKDYQNEIQNWMDQYERDMESREMDIYDMNVNIEKIIDKHEALKVEYEERARKMADWRIFKQKRKEEEERIALENWAAGKIQAWWRGVMVRKKLGPYRKRKGKKSKKGKKDTGSVKSKKKN